MSIYRRDIWPSRDAAAQSFKKSKFYQGWDERVLQRWIDFGLRATEDGQVTLATTKHQEVFTYLRPSWPAYDSTGKNLIHPEKVPDLDRSLGQEWPQYPLYRPEGPNTLAQLPRLRPSVLYVYGGQSDLSPPNLREEKVNITGTAVGGSGGAKAGRVSQVTSQTHGHLIPMEAPQLCARASTEWIKGEIERWQKDESEYEEWTNQPQAAKSTISEEYKNRLGKPNRATPKSNAKL